MRYIAAWLLGVDLQRVRELRVGRRVDQVGHRFQNLPFDRVEVTDVILE